MAQGPPLRNRAQVHASYDTVRPRHFNNGSTPAQGKNPIRRPFYKCVGTRTRGGIRGLDEGGREELMNSASMNEGGLVKLTHWPIIQIGKAQDKPRGGGHDMMVMMRIGSFIVA
jgi:hypothetical protein